MIPPVVIGQRRIQWVGLTVSALCGYRLSRQHWTTIARFRYLIVLVVFLVWLTARLLKVSRISLFGRFSVAWPRSFLLWRWSDRKADRARWSVCLEGYRETRPAGRFENAGPSALIDDACARYPEILGKS